MPTVRSKMTRFVHGAPAEAVASGNFPASIKAAQNAAFQDNPVQSPFVAMLPHATARPPLPILGKVWDALKGTKQQVLEQNQVPKAVLDDIQRRMQAELDQVGSAAKG